MLQRLIGLIREKPVTSFLSLIVPVLGGLWYLSLFRKDCASQSWLIVCIYEAVRTDKVALEWEREVKLSEDEHRIRRFIDEYQHGLYVSLAQSRLKAAEAWALVKNSSNPAVIAEFLSENRDRVFDSLARDRLSRLDERAWQQAAKLDNIDAYTTYRRVWSPSGRHLAEAQDRSAALQEIAAWVEAQTLNSMPGYVSYQLRFPHGKHIQKANEQLEKLQDEAAWEQAKRKDTIAAYDLYLLSSSKKRRASQAQARIDSLDEAAWNEAQGFDTIDRYKRYQSLSPRGKYSQDAARRIAKLQEEVDWQRLIHEPSMSALRRFLNDWPRSAHQSEARQLLANLEDDAAWTEAVAESTAAGFRAYMRGRPHGRNAQDARRRLRALDEEAWNRLSRGHIDDLKQYLSGWAADGVHLDDARRKIAQIQDDEAWQDAVRDGTSEGIRQYLGNPLWVRHKSEAQQRLDQLAEAAWSRARDVDTPEAYASYERSFPDSPHIFEARRRLAELTQPQECDRLAANPDDPEKVTNGIPYIYMDAEAAIFACKQAVAQFPRIPRFRYQLARAYQKASKLQSALPLLRQLASERYISAYDNLGWIYFNNKGIPRDIGKAIDYFKQGASANQPEAMTSLGILFEYIKNYDDAMQWYRKAANLDYERARELLYKLESTPSADTLEPTAHVPPEVIAIQSQLFQLLMEKIQERRR